MGDMTYRQLRRVRGSSRTNDGFRVLEMTLRYRTDYTVAAGAISSPALAFDYVRPLVARSVREVLIVLYLDNKNRPIEHVVSVGTLSESIIHPREVFAGALLTYSSSLILVHNHPSGILTPSRDDLAATTRIAKAGEILGIPLTDHLIVSDTDYYSMHEHGEIA